MRLYQQRTFVLFRVMNWGYLATCTTAAAEHAVSVSLLLSLLPLPLLFAFVLLA